MKTKAFSVYDSKAKFYSVPFFMPTTGAAVRAFSDLANDRSSAVNRHPSDYVLYEVGSFDDADGSLTAIIPFANLGLASDFVTEVPKKQWIPPKEVIDAGIGVREEEGKKIIEG